MRAISSPIRQVLSVACAAVVVGPLAACGPSVLAVEVLPPRTSATCSAPAANAAALGSGLFDAEATVERHGSYIADLRLTSRSDVVIDSVERTFTLPEDANSDSTEAAEKAGQEVPLGDAILVGDEDDVRIAVVENVELIPRELALALRDDADLALSGVEYATVVVNLTAISRETTLGTDPSTFAIEVCAGCLVAEPSVDDCPGGIVEHTVCRPGQDRPLFTCRQQP